MDRQQPSGLLSQELDRRRFLGTGAAAIAAAALLPGGARADTPKRGGNLRVALLGGGASDTIDAHASVSVPDTARAIALWEGLTRLDVDGKVVNALAESMTANADATEWVIRLRKGVTFHDGKPLKPEDVIFSYKRVANPKAPFSGAGALQAVDLDNAKVLDDTTLKLPMKMPYAGFPECISAAYLFDIVPVGYDPKNPVGTGPFKFKSFTPGQESVFTRYDGYWQSGLPYLDSVTMIDSFADGTAAFNAVQGGQVDVFASAPLALASQASEGGPIKRLVSKPGQWTPFTMRVDQAPFDNPDVRMAFRLLVDRQQLIDLSLSGYGEAANDVFSPWDSCFDSSLKRHRDLDQAKSLLKKAGQENMSVELVTSDIAAGVLQAAQVFAQQAKDAGVTVKVRQVTPDVFFGDQYLKWPFAQDIWYYAPYLGQVFQSSLPSSPFNETHWGNDAYTKLYNQAQATPDPAKRCDILHEMQKIDFEQGGYIIPAFNRNVDLMAANVQGFQPAATGISLGNFGFASAWLA